MHRDDVAKTVRKAPQRRRFCREAIHPIKPRLRVGRCDHLAEQDDYGGAIAIRAAMSRGEVQKDVSGAASIAIPRLRFGFPLLVADRPVDLLIARRVSEG